jgi:competence ComEA-like helix-hairpin-helix protein
MRRRAASTLPARLALCCLLTLACGASCVKLPRRAGPGAIPTDPRGSTAAAATPQVNVNEASAEELERLPGVGPALAARIVEHRERYGPFRRAEHLLIVRGMSESRLRALRGLVRVD